MAASEVEVCNMALAAIGSTDFIESLTEDSVEAGVCNRFFTKCVRETLEKADWPFATRQTAPAVPSEAAHTGWEYIYTLPADCARPIALLADGERVGQWSSVDKGAHSFELQLDAAKTGRVLLTDLSASGGDFDVLEYVAYVDHVPLFPELFVDAVMWLLASWLALGIAKKPQMAAAMRAQHELGVGAGVAAQFNGMQADAETDTSTILARG